MRSSDRPPHSADSPAVHSPNLRLVHAPEPEAALFEEEVTEIYEPPLAPQPAPSEEPSGHVHFEEMEVRYEFEGAKRTEWFPSEDATRSPENATTQERTGDFDIESFYEDQRTDVFSFDELWTRTPSAESVPSNTAAPVQAIAGPFPGDDAFSPQHAMTSGEAPAPSGKGPSRIVMGGATVLCLFLSFLAFTKRPSSSGDLTAPSSPASEKEPGEGDGESRASRERELGTGEDEGAEEPTEKEIARATPAIAARSFSVGDYKVALRHYRILARVHPRQEAYAVIVRALQRQVRSQGGAR